MPELRTKFEVEHHQDGRVSAKYVASDENLSRAMLVGREPYDEHEASSHYPGQHSLQRDVAVFPNAGIFNRPGKDIRHWHAVRISPRIDSLGGNRQFRLTLTWTALTLLTRQ